MAKKLLAVLIAVMMIVPMVFMPASADTFTYNAAIRFDAEVGHGYCANQDADHPLAAYHLMARIVIDWTDSGTEENHGSISWVNGSPNSAFGFDFFTGKMFVAMTGWNGQVNDNTNFLAQEDFVLEDGEYYQVDWYVSDTEIKGYVNGELVIDYVGSGLWNAGGYIITYPQLCKYDILDMSCVAQDNSAVYSQNVASWAYSGALWGDASGGYSIEIQDYVVERYEIIDWAPYAAAVEAKINAIGNVGYNEWVSVTDTDCMSYEAASGWGPYDDVQASIGAPYRLEMDVQIVEDKSGTSIIGGNAQGGGGAYLGYNIDAGKFFIAPGVGSTAPNFENVYGNAVVTSEGTTTLDPSKVYTIGLVFGADYVAVEFQGSEVIRSNAYSFVSGDFHLGCPNVKFNIFGYRVSFLGSDTIVQEDNWSAHSANATLSRGITCTADKFVNSGAAIAAARAAYDAANQATKDLVTNYTTLTDAEALYNQKVAAVAQTEANEVIALINAIGTVTVDSLDAILAAEQAYAGVAPAVQNLVTNYATLTAARAAYNTMVANIAGFNAAVDAIGTVYYQTPTNTGVAYDGEGFLGTFGNDDGYSNQLFNGTTELRADYIMEFDFQVVDYDATQSKSQLAGGAQNFLIGYDFPTHKFTINWGVSSWADLDPDEDCGIGATEMELIPECVYHWKLEVKGNRITLSIDGVKVAERNDGTTENPLRVDGNYFILYPWNCSVKFANYKWSVNPGDGYVVVEEATGAALIASQATWGRSGPGYGTDLVTLHADAILDSGSYIAAAQTAYANLTQYEKSQVTAAKAVLDQKAAAYAELANAEPPHVHNYNAVVTAPTCTEQGYTTYTCECGDSYVADYVPAAGHNYVGVVTAPTCTEAGYTTYTCSVCRDTYTGDAVPATGHNFVDGFCTVCHAEDPDYVPPVTYGDLNGDGEIKGSDLTLLRKYLANYDETTGTSSVTINVAAADTNGDGELNNKDATLLRRFLANYDETTGTSTVVLGPQA